MEILDLADLELGDLTVTSMRDTVALPETGMSSQDQSLACSCCGSSSCCATPDIWQPMAG